jgi:NAD(P)-dependent dehydrogenase (short-subunit alcohol dehydrogenase family)
MHNDPYSDRQVAVVTGAASGIGRAFALRLLRRGDACVAADIDRAGLASLAEEAASAAERLSTWVTDVADPADVESLADHSFRRFGSTDLLINCAGILLTGRSWEIPLDQWRRVLEVNLFSLVHALHSFVPRLIAQGRGHIVNIASMAAVTSGALVGPYSTSKHGVLAVSECLARELQAIGSPVRVSVVLPGAVETGIARDLAADTADDAGELNRTLRDAIAEGMPADQLVDFVLDRMAAGAFAIFPHPAVCESARRRLESLLSGAQF